MAFLHSFIDSPNKFKFWMQKMISSISNEYTLYKSKIKSTFFFWHFSTVQIWQTEKKRWQWTMDGWWFSLHFLWQFDRKSNWEFVCNLHLFFIKIWWHFHSHSQSDESARPTKLQNEFCIHSSNPWYNKTDPLFRIENGVFLKHFATLTMKFSNRGFTLAAMWMKYFKCNISVHKAEM